MKHKKTIACDLDGTLAEYDKWIGEHHIGRPISGTIARVRAALSAGHEVYIYTARVAPPDGIATADSVDLARAAVEEWCEAHLGFVLPVTAVKLRVFDEFWDDKAVRVAKNEGQHELSHETLWHALGHGQEELPL